MDVAQSHTNYQISITAEELVGVTKLDEPIDIIHSTNFKMDGTLSLCTILLNYLKMQDGHPMITEVHREDYCKITHMIIPQAEEAERMGGMMHKNLPVFLFHMLKDAGFTEDFIKKLLKETCKASLVTEVSLCKWDRNTRTLITPANEKHKKKLKAFDGAAWFKDEFGFLKKGAESQPCLPPEELFNLDGSSLGCLSFLAGTKGNKSTLIQCLQHLFLLSLY